MHETEGTSGANPDPLAEIIRAAGRRSVPSQDDYDTVYSAARTAWKLKVKSRRQRRWMALAAAVAVVAITGGVLQFLQSTETPDAATVAIVQGGVEWRSPETDGWSRIADGGMQLASGIQIRTAGDARAALQLKDGGSLRLHADTELTVGRDTFALASGRLYFASEDRPESMAIAIETRFGIVRDVGTQFEVRSLADSLRVRVRSGEVALLDSRAAEDLFGTAGDELELSSGGQLVKSTIAPDDPDWQWAEALATVPAAEGQSVLSYLRWIERETGKQLRWESDIVEQRAELTRFRGNPAGLTPLELLGNIEDTSDFRIDLTPDGAILVGRNL